MNRPLLTQRVGNCAVCRALARSRRSVWRSRCFSAIVAADASGAGAHPGDVGNRPRADCRTFTEQEVCNICSNPRRQENGQICVVESPADIYAIEQTGQFSGRYFVLMGHLSPLDGIGPDDIGLDRLEQRLAEEKITEVISPPTPRLKVKLPLTTLPSFARNMTWKPAESLMAFRLAASWKWSTAPRCHTPLPGVIRFVLETRAGSPALA